MGRVIIDFADKHIINLLDKKTTLIPISKQIQLFILYLEVIAEDEQILVLDNLCNKEVRHS